MKHHAINYVEFAAKDLGSTEAFFHRVFGWDFTPYGPEYIAFSGSGLEGGFYQAEKMANVNSCLLYTSPSPRDRQKSRMPSSA